jgi:hypothetical protein
MNLQRRRFHSSFMTFMDFAGQKSIGSPAVCGGICGVVVVMVLPVSRRGKSAFARCFGESLRLRQRDPGHGMLKTVTRTFVRVNRSKRMTENFFTGETSRKSSSWTIDLYRRPCKRFCHEQT